MIRSGVTWAVAGLALGLAALGLVAGVAVTPDPGVVLGDRDGPVLGVTPGSPAWRDGIRAGQPVLEMPDAAAEGGWLLVVWDGVTERGTSVAGHAVRLQAAVPFAVIGLAVVALGGLLVVRDERAGLALLAPGLALATLPLTLTGSPRDAALATPGALALGVAALALVAPRRPAVVGGAIAGVLSAAWVASVLAAPAAFDAVEATRVPALGLLGGWTAWHAGDRRRLRRWAASPAGPAAFDLLYVSVVAAALVGGVLFLGLSPLAAALAGIVALGLLPLTRRAGAGLLERLLMGRMRRDAETRAIEEERGRLAREIHDAPLQSLAAVITRLDAQPAAAHETRELREVAAQLREVATALHPPVLQDLGLGAALEDLGDGLRAREPAWTIRVEVDDLTSAARPPADVELAAFRIAQEATTNSLRHSGGRSLALVATVAPAAIDLVVRDDGRGFAADEVSAARRHGHFGLAGMHDRAEGIGAVLRVDSTPAGTQVHLAWEAEA